MNITESIQRCAGDYVRKSKITTRRKELTTSLVTLNAHDTLDAEDDIGYVIKQQARAVRTQAIRRNIYSSSSRW